MNCQNTSLNPYCSRMFQQSSFNTLLVILLLQVFQFCTTVVAADLTCEAVRPLLDIKEVPTSTEHYKGSINGSHSRICRKSSVLSEDESFPKIATDGQCCSEVVEGKLNLLSRQSFDRTIKQSLTRLASIFSIRAQKFNDFFHELLVRSKIEFHAMFRRTYGVIYEQNSYVFTDLFAELEKYYDRGNVDLTEAMENFFNTLYQKMFTVLNSQYNFDDRYLICVSDHMKDLKPFGDVPDKLSIQVKRSFVATRTYVVALHTASEIVKSMLALKPTKECLGALMKMQHCGTCNGFIQRACSIYCINVMKGCLSFYAEIDTEWNNFVAAMEKVSERLIGPFNIEMVVYPIDIKISEAIMTFQENGHAVSQQVFQKCGHPKLGRRKRHVLNKKQSIYSPQNLKGRNVNMDLDFEINFEESSLSKRMKKSVSNSQELELQHVRFPKPNTKRKNQDGNKNNRKKNQKKVKTGEKSTYNNDQPNLDRIIKDIKVKVKDTSKFWSNLPYQFCNNDELAAAPSKDNNCWNGTRIERYLHPMVEDGLAAQKFNPEVLVNVNKSNVVVDEQQLLLRTVVANLRNAYNGMDVEWADYEESYDNSGSGSGNGSFDTEENDNNHEDSSGASNNHNIDLVNIPVIYDPSNNIPNSAIDVNDLETKINFNDNLPNIHTNAIDKHDFVNIHYDNTSNSSSIKTEMSLTRALMGYLFPIFIMWFGEMLVDLL